jgi:hypothetical protein
MYTKLINKSHIQSWTELQEDQGALAPTSSKKTTSR